MCRAYPSVAGEPWLLAPDRIGAGECCAARASSRVPISQFGRSRAGGSFGRDDRRGIWRPLLGRASVVGYQAQRRARLAGGDTVGLNDRCRSGQHGDPGPAWASELSSKPILIPACVVPVLPRIVVGRDVASRGMWSPDEAGNRARPASTRAGWAVHRDCAVGRSCRARSDASADRSGRGLLPVRRGRRGRLGFAVGRFGFAAGQLAGEPAGPPHPPAQVQVQRCDQHGSHHDRV